MEVIYHPLARRDVLEILRYYYDISPKLEYDFHEELRATISKAAQNPLRFHSPTTLLWNQCRTAVIVPPCESRRTFIAAPQVASKQANRLADSIVQPLRQADRRAVGNQTLLSPLSSYWW